MLKRSWFVPLFLLMIVACERAEPPVLVLDERIRAEVSERVARAFNRPAVSAAMDQFFAAIVAEPTVRQRVNVLAEKLMAEPKITGAVAALMERVAASPEMARTVAQLMAANPNATAEQIGDLAGMQFESTWETPQVSEAWMAAWNAFVAKLDAGRTLAAVERGLTARISSLMGDEQQRMKKWSARLTQLNGGKRPDTARATELYLQHAWSEARIDGLLTKLLGDPSVRAASSAALAELLAIEPVREDIRRSAAQAISDPAVQDGIVRALLVLYTPQPVTAEVRAALENLLTHASVVGPTKQLLQALLAEPRVTTIASDWFDRMRKDPTVKRELEAFWDAW